MSNHTNAAAHSAGVGPLYAQILYLAAPLSAGAFLRLHRHAKQAAPLVVNSNGSEL
jgi:hypothetical protein